MRLPEKIKFHLLKYLRIIWFMVRYSIYKWKDLEGIKIPVYLKYGYPVLRFIDNNEYEKSEISIIKATLTSEDVVLELGTGIGFVSAFCSKKIGSEKVYTFEANSSLKPAIYELYKKNKVQPRLTFAMLGQTDKNEKFHKNKKSFLASSSQRNINEECDTVTVEKKDLNKVIEEISPTYLIMDIEGGEYDIFQSINFHTIKKIQFELHPLILGSEKVNSIFNRLLESNFVQEFSYAFPDNYYFIKKNYPS